MNGLTSSMPVLHSGYVSIDTQRLRRPNPVDPSLQQILIAKVTPEPMFRYWFNEEVDALYNAWTSDNTRLKDFDFRERVLTAAFRAFGVRSLRTWVEAQQRKPKYSLMHQRYLLETLEFIYFGKTRALKTLQWVALLSASDETNSVQTDLTPYFGPQDSLVGGGRSVAMCDIIQAWCSRPGGFEDLMVSLYVIFGSRTSSFAVSRGL